MSSYIQFLEKDLYEIKEKLRNAQRILVMSHVNPDGDTIGCGLAWRYVLDEAEKDVVNFCVSPIPEKQKFLPGWEVYTSEIPDFDSFDLIIINDHGAIKLTGMGEEQNAKLLNSSTPLLNIDHHPSNKGFGDINIVVTHAASATQIIADLFSRLNLRITPDIATCLLNGLYTDTGSFQHDNTSPEALKVAAMLMRRGANFKAIADKNFHNLNISTLRLWGKVFENIQQNEYNITSSVITESDMKEIGAKYEELEGVVDFLNHVPKTYFTVLLSERGDVVKGSLRTRRDDVDVAEVASQFSGGGHKKAAGFAVKGKIIKKDNMWQIIDKEKEVLKQ